MWIIKKQRRWKKKRERDEGKCKESMWKKGKRDYKEKKMEEKEVVRRKESLKEGRKDNEAKEDIKKIAEIKKVGNRWCHWPRTISFAFYRQFTSTLSLTFTEYSTFMALCQPNLSLLNIKKKIMIKAQHIN